MKTFLVNGLPRTVARDGWWLGGQATPPPRTQHRQDNSGALRPVLLVALVALGDAMIWQVMPGLSMAVFGAALMLVALWVAGYLLTPRRQAFIVAAALLVLLPLVEIVNPLSMGIAVVGISALLALVAGVRPGALPRAVARLWPMGVEGTIRDAAQAVRIDGSADVPGALGRLVMAWLMPVLLGGVFLILLLVANPVADRWLTDLSRADVRLPDAVRVLFWLCLLPLGWTALSLHRMRERLCAAPRGKRSGPARLGLINPASVTRALLVFNALFAVQTGMDAVYLYGGLGLPEGISYASYAHRGAYPLVVTGLLAGVFALLTRRWVQGDRVLRILLMVFVAQNVALVVSSLVRLEMYVGQYGLTQLRVAAGLWMGLTAAGLALILWQIAARHENGWLMVRGGALTAAVLYICAWIPFDAVIARHNLAHHSDRSSYYICQLGDASKPIVRAREMAQGYQICGTAKMRVRTPADWREWGWRNARARSSLGALEAEVLQ